MRACVACMHGDSRRKATSDLTEMYQIPGSEILDLGNLILSYQLDKVRRRGEQNRQT